MRTTTTHSCTRPSIPAHHHAAADAARKGPISPCTTTAASGTTAATANPHYSSTRGHYYFQDDLANNATAGSPVQQQEGGRENSNSHSSHLGSSTSQYRSSSTINSRSFINKASMGATRFASVEEGPRPGGSLGDQHDDSTFQASGTASAATPRAAAEDTRASSGVASNSPVSLERTFASNSERSRTSAGVASRRATTPAQRIGGAGTGGRSLGRRSSAPLLSARSSSGGGGAERGTGSDAGDMGTFRHQASLPKLEVPALEETLDRYLGAVAPLVSAEAFARTKTVVEEFKTGGEGEALQQALLKYSSDKDSYVEEFWDDSYLTPKSSVVLNLNPFFVFETPTLSTHTRDPGGELGGSSTATAAVRSPSGNSPSCSSCRGGGSGSGSSGISANGYGGCSGGKSRGGNGRRTPPDHRRGLQHLDHFPAGCGYDDVGEAAPVPAPATSKMQARRAASLLFSSLRFASAVKSETLPPDLWRDTPLCMSQYRRLFGAHRKAVENDPDEMMVCEDSRHVVILCKNQFYCFSALHPDGRMGITEEELEEVVQAVQEDAAKASLAETAGQAVGVLTTETRDEWAVARKRLAVSGEHNKRYLHLVDTALFVLCLDHTSPSTAAEIASSCLHGSYALEGDVQVGTCTNRWYDKLQLIVFENGAAGVNFEHTWVDGHTVLRFASDVFADVIYRFANHLTSTTGSGKDGIGAVFPVDKRPLTLCEGRTPRKMEWRLPTELRRAVYFAETRISDLIRQHDVQALEYDTFGKRFITANKMSPDAFVQMGIVYGYYGLYGDVVAAYEPVLTKMFLKGRTEALRTVTAEVKGFLEAFCNTEISTKRKMLSLRSAIVSHGRLVKLAAKGKGVDRHLFALLSMAKRQATAAVAAAAEATAEGGDGEAQSPRKPSSRIPELFEDEAWRVMNHVILSTSNCGNPSLRLFGFGPVVRDGFGVGYIIKENQLQLVVTSKNRQTDRFVGKIRQFFDQVYNAYSPAQIGRRVRVASASDSSDDSGGYSMWGSFTNRGGQPLL